MTWRAGVGPFLGVRSSGPHGARWPAGYQLLSTVVAGTRMRWRAGDADAAATLVTSGGILCPPKSKMATVYGHLLLAALMNVAIVGV